MGLSTSFLTEGVALAASPTEGPSEGFLFIADGNTCGVATKGFAVRERHRGVSFNEEAISVATGFGFLPEDPTLRHVGRWGPSRSSALPLKRLGPSPCFIGPKLDCTFFLGVGREGPLPGSEK